MDLLYSTVCLFHILVPLLLMLLLLSLISGYAITTDTLGDVTIVGPGAGRRETGFSLLNDLVAIAKGGR